MWITVDVVGKGKPKQITCREILFDVRLSNRQYYKRSHNSSTQHFYKERGE